MSALAEPRRATWCSNTPVISFSFDDFPRSAYLAGGAILVGLGIRATYYTAIGHMKREGQLVEEDLARLIEDGNELACHTHTHVSSHAVQADVFELECETNRSAAARIVPGTVLENFAYPYGYMTEAVVALVGRHYLSARTTVEGVNHDEIDLLRLRAVRVYDRLDNLSDLADRIERNTRIGGWLIFYTHDVSDSPSAYGCSPSLLGKVAHLAKASGADILTVREALKRVRRDDGLSVASALQS
jgi:peptidoglycan/xylan/chitin deacetylase (PgdA/CDA1 family)